MKYPNFYYEKRLWKKGFKIVAGVDEVGRGCFAGPIVAAAVAFTPAICDMLYEIRDTIKIDDSKKLTERQRIITNKWIKENAATWGIGEASVAEINRLGMARATRSAFRRAVAKANIRAHARIDFLLIDAFYIPYIRGFPMRRKYIRKKHKLRDSRARQLAIVNGDEKSFSIAAASIIAKVYRDRLMEKLGKRKNFQKFTWGQNKGYGTKAHREAILKYGTTRYHRKQFVETFYKKELNSSFSSPVQSGA